ncbi:MAG: metal ABC transporter solute-binding protein, Zn/Mn family [Fibrobacterota bacterium]
MKSITFAFMSAVAVLICSGCNKTENTSNMPVIFTSILPQKTFAEDIAGPEFEIVSLVGPGESPHSFNPTPSQMASLAKAAVFFTVGTALEETLIPKIRSVSPSLIIKKTDIGIQKRTLAIKSDCESHDHEHAHHHEENGDSGKDPHIWLSPKNAAKIAENIATGLSEIFPGKKDIFMKNLSRFKKSADSLHMEILKVLEPVRGEKLFVFHPAFGYFADEYGLEQIAVEIRGREPGAKELARIIEEARKNNVKIIFVQPQFSQKSASVIAREIGGAVIPFDPLPQRYFKTLGETAQAVRESLEKQKSPGE